MLAVLFAVAALSGTVLEKGTRRELAGIEVSVPALERSALTDVHGRFELNDLPPGEHEVVIAAPGHLRFSTLEKLVENERTEVTYRIEREFTSGLEATVQGERERQELSRTRLGPAELTETPGSQGDALKVVEDLPGVARTSPLGGGPLVIRGSNPVDSGVFLDGHQIPLLYHFFALSSTFNSDLIQSIDYLPGNFGADHGDITGGLVDVKSRAPRSGFHGYARASVIDGSLLLEGNVPEVEGLNFAVAGRRSFIDLALNGVSSDSFNFTTAPQYYDAQFKLDYKPAGSRHSLSLLALISDDKLGLLVKRPSASDPNQSGNIYDENQFGQVRLRHSFHAGAFSLDTSGFAGFEYFNSQVAPSFDVKSTEVLLGLRSTASYGFSDLLGVSVGLDVKHSHVHYHALAPALGPPREGDQEGKFSVDQPTVNQPWTSADSFNPALWGELRLRPIESVTFTGGVRGDVYTYPGQKEPSVSVSPRLALRWELSEAVALKAGAGLYTQGSRLVDSTRAFGNPDLAPQRAWQASLGTELRLIPGVLFTAEGFYKRLDRIPVRTDASVLVNGQPVPLNLDNAGVGRVWGVEIFLRKELTERLFGWVSYTYSKSERLDRPGLGFRVFDYDQPHNLTAVVSYKLPRGWQVGGRFRLISGNPSTPVLGSKYLASSDTYLPIYGATNSARVPAFSQLDVRVDKTWTYDQWTLNAFIDVLNAYNHASIEGVAYSYNYAQHAYINGLPIIPSIGLKGEF